MRIIGSAQTTNERTRSDAVIGRDAWSLLAWLGTTFILMGAIDIGLGTYPMAFGNAEWEFGVVSSILNGFAIPTMGCYLLLASSIARGSSGLTRGVAIGMVVVALTLVVLGLLYVTVVPVALKAVNQSDVVYLGMKKAVVKALTFLLAYWLLYVVGAIKGWRAAR